MSQTLKSSRYEWSTLNWRKIQVCVFKLQRRIYRAAQRGDERIVRRLQRLMVRSWSARLLAVRRVSQDNAGKRTAGIDGVSSLSPAQRLATARELSLKGKASAVRRIWIAKSSGPEKRPLGIPIMADRARQALVKLALEPAWEAKFEPNSYGFRPGRSAHDAIGAIFQAICHKPKYVLDADIAQCFDRINHSVLLAKLKVPPWLRRPIQGWLKAGVWDHRQWYPSQEGTPQGGVLSPLLANIALHGMEQDLKAQFPARDTRRAGQRYQASAIQVVRYADDFVVLHADRAVIEAVQTALESWLAPLGLQLKASKTHIVHTLGADGVATGFDFLGFNIRQYPVSPKQKASGYKTLIKPSKAAIKRHKQTLRTLMRSYSGHRQPQLIRCLNTSIRGWSRYYSTVVSSRCFQHLDNYLKLSLLRWTRKQNGRCYAKVNRYWGINRGQGWTFSTPEGLRLVEHRQTPITRHVKVRSNKSPYDGDWPYWTSRSGAYPGVKPQLAQLLKRQAGKCASCGLFFDWESTIEIHHLNGNWRNNQLSNLQALHRHCHDQTHSAVARSKPCIHDKNSLAKEPCEVKVSSTVLKPSGGGDPFA
ncbi:MAG: group II intron reverse transcriptase/maturase [Cyanobacteria bacterium Co-bin8]|nr:group II intron reverse transcriptase/maturase [Cyanobacteria bacterium Co-bin8]